MGSRGLQKKGSRVPTYTTDDVFTCEELESIKKAKNLGCISSM